MTARFAAPAACPTGRDTSPDALRDVPGTTTPASPPAPRATAEQAAALRRDLEATGWGVDSVHHLLGDAADAALRREIRLPALRALRRALDEDRAAGAAPNPTAVLTALFMLGQTVPAAELDSALRRTRTRGALAMVLVEFVPDADVPRPDPGPTGGPGDGPGPGDSLGIVGRLALSGTTARGDGTHCTAAPATGPGWYVMRYLPIWTSSPRRRAACSTR